MARKLMKINSTLCVLIFGFIFKIGAQVAVDVNLNVKHTVGGISEFDRSKFITIHATHDQSSWHQDNASPDLRDEFLNGFDVYLGRDTGAITWRLRTSNEDPNRPGFADPAHITSRGINARNNYAASTDDHAYEFRRKNYVVAAQLHPFWTGESQKETNNGWKFANATATGEYMGRYFNEFFGGNGLALPTWIEVINEPAYEALGGKSDFTNSLQEVADFHVDVADAMRVQNPDFKIGGYTVAFPDFETGNFQRWINRDKLFIDVAGEKMDFWSWHLYDFPAIGGKVKLRSGSNVEATFDMHDNYSLIKLGTTKPYVISEYGAQTHDFNGSQYTPARDWLFLKSQNSLMMSFMERPQDIAIAIPFTILKAEWGYNETTGVPYGARLMRKANEPNSYTGEWVYTARVLFYDLWKNVKGTRIDTKASDLDVLVDAYIDGNKGYVILNNLEFNTVNIALNVFDDYNTNITSVLKRHLTISGDSPILEEETFTSSISEVELGAESTIILEYTFDKDIVIDEASDEVKYFADDYFKEIQASQPIEFNIANVVKNETHGEGVLRLSIGRDHGKSLNPKVTINGTELIVPQDYRGYNQADRIRFFGTLEIPVSYGLLKSGNNEVKVEFPDSGGHVSSIALQVFDFSSNIRDINLANLPASNYKVKGINATCVSKNNGEINIVTDFVSEYKALITSTDYNENFTFTNNLSVDNLSPGTYDIEITAPAVPDYKIEFVLEIGEPEVLGVTSKVAANKDAVTLNLEGSNSYVIELNGETIKTGLNKITLELKEGANSLKVKTDKDCQGVYKESFFVDQSFHLFPNPVEEELSVVVSEKLINSTAYIYNIVGTLVKTRVIADRENFIDVNSFEKGVYLIVFKKEKEQVSHSKFVIK